MEENAGHRDHVGIGHILAGLSGGARDARAMLGIRERPMQFQERRKKPTAASQR